MTTTLKVSGMTCASCVRDVETSLKNVPGVEAVQIDFAAGAATVEGTPDASALVVAVEDEGYGASVVNA